MTVIDRDASGWPVLLAESTPAPKSGAADVVTQLDLPPSSRPANVDHIEWARRQDAVRDAAREFEVLSDQDLRERLRGATTKPLEDGDVAQFTADVRAAVLDDLVDILDQATRGKLRGRRTVRVNAPRGYVKKTMHSLKGTEADQVEGRLRARGWNDAQVRDGFRSKLPAGRQDEASTDSDRP